MQNDSLITHNEPKSPISEAYRVLRTNLMFSSLDKVLKVIAITSAQPSEGKSTTISNLAVAFAQSGSNVLILDMDLRKPQIHKVFGLSNRSGTTNAIVTPESYEYYIHKTLIPGLSVMTSGPIPPNPSELLASNKMKTLLQSIREVYDVILIDTPPVGIVTDAQIISTIADGIILVVASGMAKIQELERAKELLTKVNANILGTVLTKLDKKNHDYYYSYYYEDGASSSRKKKRV